MQMVQMRSIISSAVLGGTNKILGSYRKRQDFTTVKFIWKNSSIRDMKAEPWWPLSYDYWKQNFAFVKKGKNEMITMVPVNPKIEYL